LTLIKFQDLVEFTRPALPSGNQHWGAFPDFKAGKGRADHLKSPYATILIETSQVLAEL